MRRAAAAALASCAALAAAGGAGAALRVELHAGDAVRIARTSVGCRAVDTSGKLAIACFRYGRRGPLHGSFGASLAIDGTVVVQRVGADGRPRAIFRRRLASRAAALTTYRLRPGDSFGLPRHDISCEVIRISGGPLRFRGVKVACYRAGRAGALPRSYGIAVANRFAGIFRFDAAGNPAADVYVRTQPRR